jgi:hypothetical protein
MSLWRPENQKPGSENRKGEDEPPHDVKGMNDHESGK